MYDGHELPLGMGDIAIVDTVESAEAVVAHLMASARTEPWRRHAADTEVCELDIKTVGPIGNGVVTCLTVYSGPDFSYEGARIHGAVAGTALFVDCLAPGVLEAFRPWLECDDAKKVWHNYGFDRHVIENHGFDMRGFQGDTFHMARLHDTALGSFGGAGYSLEALSDQLIAGPKKIPMKKLFPDLFKDFRSTAELKTIRALQTNELTRDAFKVYAAYDAKSTWDLYEELRRRLTATLWQPMSNPAFEGRLQEGRIENMFDLYEHYYVAFGDLLTKMEKNGIFVDRDDHLKQVEIQATADLRACRDEFKTWCISQLGPDGAYVNPSSNKHLQVLLFGGSDNSVTRDRIPDVLTFALGPEDLEADPARREHLFSGPKLVTLVQFCDLATADQIKAELKKRGLKASGNKADLTTRLLDYDAALDVADDDAGHQQPQQQQQQKLNVDGAADAAAAGDLKDGVEAPPTTAPREAPPTWVAAFETEKGYTSKSSLNRLKRDKLVADIEEFNQRCADEGAAATHAVALKDGTEKDRLKKHLVSDLWDRLVGRPSAGPADDNDSRDNAAAAAAAAAPSAAPTTVGVMMRRRTIPALVEAWLLKHGGNLEDDKWMSSIKVAKLRDMAKEWNRDVAVVGPAEGPSALQVETKDPSGKKLLAKAELRASLRARFDEVLGMMKQEPTEDLVGHGPRTTAVEGPPPPPPPPSKEEATKDPYAEMTRRELIAVCRGRNIHVGERVDVEAMREALRSDAAYATRLRELAPRAPTLLPHPNPNKVKRFATIRRVGSLQPWKFTPAGAPACGADVISELAGDYHAMKFGKAYEAFGGGEPGERACAALDALARMSNIEKMLSTFISPLRVLADANSRIHTSLNVNTDTGRLSSRKPNLQNQPALDKDFYLVRKAFQAEPGKLLVVADYGQLELRVLAHVAGCESMLQAFRDGGCFHSRTAVGMYPYIKAAVESGEVLLEKGTGANDEDKPLVKDKYAAERRNAKTLNFSIAYGKTAFGLAKDFGVSTDEAAKIVDLWYADRPEVRAWQKQVIEDAKRDFYTSTLLGRRRTLNMFKEKDRASVGRGERAAINTPIQGSAADIVTMAMLKIDENDWLRDNGWKLLLQIHDEVILEGPEETADAALRTVVKCMEEPFDDVGCTKLKVDLVVDANRAKTWYEAK